MFVLSWGTGYLGEDGDGSIYKAHWFDTYAEAREFKSDRGWKYNASKIVTGEIDYDAIADARRTLVELGLGHIVDANEQMHEVASVCIGRGVIGEATKAIQLIYTGGFKPVDTNWRDYLRK